MQNKNIKRKSNSQKNLLLEIYQTWLWPQFRYSTLYFTLILLFIALKISFSSCILFSRNLLIYFLIISMIDTQWCDMAATWLEGGSYLTREKLGGCCSLATLVGHWWKYHNHDILKLTYHIKIRYDMGKNWKNLTLSKIH